MPREHGSTESVWGKYLLASAIDWLVIALVAWVAVRWWDVPGWMAVTFIAAWIVKDLLLYPSARRYYVSEPSARRIVGERGAALSSLNPSGFVRVRGEIWQAHVLDADTPVAEGTAVRVRDIHGLQLLVEPLPRAPGPVDAR